MKKTNGFISVIVSGIIFGLMPLFVKIIINNGSNTISLVFYRFLFAIPLLILINLKLKIDLRITKDEFKDLAFISLFGYAPTAILLFLSYGYIPTGLATSLHFIYPILVTVGSVVFYKEKLNPKKAISAILCTIGIFLFLNEISISKDNFMGVILASLSGVTFAYYLIKLEKSNLRLMPTFKMILYLSTISSLALLAYGLVTQSLTIKIKPIGWLVITLFSFIVTIGAVSLLQIGVKFIGAQNASILSTTEPITSVIIGVTLLNDDINAKIILGILLIVLSVILISINPKVKRDIVQ